MTGPAPRRCIALIALLAAICSHALAMEAGAPAAGTPAAGTPAAGTPAAGTPDCTSAARSADPAAARRACLPGRESGNVVDGYNLALALHDTDPEAARSHLRWAADAGLAEAAHVLGNLELDAGRVDAGLAHLEAAARAGLALAQYDYATALLERGEGNDAAEAVRFYGHAAAGGEDAARYNMGVLLLGGRIGQAKPLHAWAWLSSLESRDGHTEMFRLAGELSSQITDQEKTRARELLRAVQADPVKAARRIAAGLEASGSDDAGP